MYQAEFGRLRGEVLLLQGNRAAAEKSLNEAIAVARAQGARSLELRAATSLARSRRERGKTEQAIGVLDPILRSIEGGSDTRDVLTARALLRSLRQ